MIDYNIMLRYNEDYFSVDDSVIRSPTYYTKTSKDSFMSGHSAEDHRQTEKGIRKGSHTHHASR